MLNFLKNLLFPTSYQKDNFKITIRDEGKILGTVVKFSVKQDYFGDHKHGFSQSMCVNAGSRKARRTFRKAKNLIKSGACDGMSTHADTIRFKHLLNSK